MEAVDVRGRFVWHELMTRDVPAAKKFYSNLIGWKPQAWPLDPGYTVCHTDYGPQAGVFNIPAELPAEMPAHWVNYIGTRDVDGTAAAAVRAGGSILKGPEDIKGAGRYAILKDPQGAAFAILDPENARPEGAGPPPNGSFAWHELATSDHEAAFAFYSGLFGWDAMERMDMGPSGIYLIFGSNGVQRGGMYIKPPDMPAPPNWLPYVSHASADAAMETALSTGARKLNGPMDVPGGRIAIFMDPTGAAVAVFSPTAAAAAPAKPKAKPKAAAKPKAKAKAKTKAKAKAKPKAKVKAKAKAPAKKKKTAKRKPVAKKKVMKRKSKPVRRKK
jgi:predicted enzyme related to lactoylglutathione lyase